MTSQPNSLYNFGAMHPAAPFPQSITILVPFLIVRFFFTSLMYSSLISTLTISFKKGFSTTLLFSIRSKISLPEIGLSSMTSFIPLYSFGL